MTDQDAADAEYWESRALDVEAQMASHLTQCAKDKAMFDEVLDKVLDATETREARLRLMLKKVRQFDDASAELHDLHVEIDGLLADLAGRRLAEEYESDRAHIQHHNECINKMEKDFGVVLESVLDRAKKAETLNESRAEEWRALNEFYDACMAQMASASELTLDQFTAFMGRVAAARAAVEQARSSK